MVERFGSPGFVGPPSPADRIRRAREQFTGPPAPGTSDFVGGRGGGGRGGGGGGGRSSSGRPLPQPKELIQPAKLTRGQKDIKEAQGRADAETLRIRLQRGQITPIEAREGINRITKDTGVSFPQSQIRRLLGGGSGLNQLRSQTRALFAIPKTLKELNAKRLSGQLPDSEVAGGVRRILGLTDNTSDKEALSFINLTPQQILESFSSKQLFGKRTTTPSVSSGITRVPKILEEQFEKREIGFERGVPTTAFFIKGTDKRVSQKQERQLRKKEQEQLTVISEPTTLEGKAIRLVTQLRSEGLSQSRIDKQLAAAGLSTVLSAVQFTKALVTDPIQTIKSFKDIPEAARRGLQTLPKTLQEEPAFVLGTIMGEVALAKGTGTGLKFVKLQTVKAGTKLSPNFRKVIEKGGQLVIENVPLKGTGQRVDIPLIQRKDSIGIDLSAQARFAGKVANPVSAAQDFLGTFTKRSRDIGKPIPSEELLTSSTKALLKRFDEGKLTNANDILRLDTLVKAETRSKGLLERAFFADLEGRLRVNRLGFESQKPASLLDILSGDIAFGKSGKAQAILFERGVIAKFPKELKGIENKLKKGQALTQSEKAKFLKFQLTPSGEFKPIGFLGREPELTLAPGEIVKRKQLGAVTLIDGNRLPIIIAKIDKASPQLKTLLNKFKSGSLNQKELPTFKNLFKSETGFELSSFIRDTRPFISKVGVSGAGISISRARPPGVSISGGSTIIKSPKPFSGSSSFKGSTTPIKSSAVSPPLVSRPFSVSRIPKPISSGLRGGSVLSSPLSGRSPFAKSFTISISPFIPRPGRGRRLFPPNIVKPINTTKRKLGIRERPNQAYHVLVRKKLKFNKINRSKLTKKQAFDLGAWVIDNSLARTARIVRGVGNAQKPQTRIPTNYFKKTQGKYRAFKKVQGNNIPTPNQFIEKRSFALDSKNERRKISALSAVAKRRKKIKSLILSKAFSPDSSTLSKNLNKKRRKQ